MNSKGRGRAQSRLHAQLTHLPDDRAVTNCVNQDTRMRISENYVDAFRTWEKDLRESEHALQQRFPNFFCLLTLLGFEK